MTILDIRIDPSNLEGLPDDFFGLLDVSVEEGQSQNFEQENLMELLNQVEWIQEEFGRFLSRSVKMMATEVDYPEDQMDKFGDKLNDDIVLKGVYNSMFNQQDIIEDYYDDYQFLEKQKYSKVILNLFIEKLDKIKHSISALQEKTFDKSIEQSLVYFIKKARENQVVGE